MTDYIIFVSFLHSSSINKYIRLFNIAQIIFLNHVQIPDKQINFQRINAGGKFRRFIEHGVEMTLIVFCNDT